MIKFKIDENLPIEASILLKNAGYNSHTVHDEELRGASDPAIYDVCLKETRVLITLDLDFADIRTYNPKLTPGIIVIRTQYQDKYNILDKISDIINFLKIEKIYGKLWIVENDRVRIRE